ncbi:MAG TPA: YihY/virulence factor BrkB family protein [Candidatus Acidoferrum sp.]|nr:YihY/virulence factor BrkB family protein [Candidatus Acidoferrum sp.]
MAAAGHRIIAWLERKMSRSGKLVRFLYALVRRYLGDRVGEKGAQLAYYFLFSLFPLVIFLTSLIGMSSFELSEFFSANSFIPEDVAEMLWSFIEYVRSVTSPTLVWTGLFLTIWFFSRVTRSLQNALDTAMRVKKRRPFPVRFAASFAITAGLLASMPLGITFALTGRTVLEHIAELIPQLEVVTEWIISTRSVVLTTYSFILIMVIYIFGPSMRLTVRQALPGTLFTLAVWMAASNAFSYYVANMARYSMLYGSLGAVLVLLLWLYITGTVVVLGGEVNGILLEMKMEQDAGERV